MAGFRRFFPYVMLLLILAAVGWAVSFGTLPPAEFTFINGAEIQSVDPAIVTGQPEGRIINGILEGLYRPMPDVDEPNNLRPAPAAAESCEISEDGKTYTFTMRPTARWTNGDRVKSYDFLWSWRRFLHPETASQYSYQLHYVQGAAKYNQAEVEIGDRVEVEIADRPDPNQLFPRGTIKSGILTAIDKPPEPNFGEDVSKEERSEATSEWKRRWVYHVDVKPQQANGDEVLPQWEADGKSQRFTKSKENADPDVTRCRHVLYHFNEVGIAALDDDTLIVTLNDRTPYFLDLVAFYPLYPVNKKCVEEHGVPKWTKPANIVTNGPFRLKFRRIRDRIRLEKNPEYWDADNVDLQTVDALAVESEVTQLNMYMNGQTDWATTVPNAMLSELKERDDFYSDAQLATYFYRINVSEDRAPLNDPRVREALNMAMNKAIITEYVTRGGQFPARSFVPPGLPGYENSLCGEYDLERAKELLAEAGYAGGNGIRKLEVLYNTSEGHRDIAEVIQQQWKKLGIDVQLKNMDWNVYLQFVEQKKYDIARAGWIGDYADPNTFLDMFITDGPNNQTGWSNKFYDELIKQSKSENDPARRMALFHDAEAILMNNWEDVGDEQLRADLRQLREDDATAGGLPVVPIYSYVSINMVRPYVKGAGPYREYDTGFFGNIQDIHPLHVMRIDQDEKQRVLEAKGLR